jgi:hypothetical protein
VGLDDKKRDLILRCVKLGMEWYRAALIAECTEEELEFIESDPTLLRKFKAYEAIEEMRLLEKHEIAIEEGIYKGNASAVQWKLERINPDRWSAKASASSTPVEFGNVAINLVGKNPDGSEC